MLTLKKILAVMLVLVVCQFAQAAELFGTVDALSGSANLLDAAGNATPVAVGSKVYEGQTIRSAQDGEVHVVTEDGGIVAVRPNTEFRVDQYQANGDSGDKMFMSLLRGTIRSITGWVGKFNHDAYRLSTPTATIGVRGTDHETTVIDSGNGDEPGTYDNVNEGATVMQTPHGSTEVQAGKYAFAPKGRAVAPFFLAARPHFLANRHLKIEDRIQQRKEGLRGQLDRMREERIRHPRQPQAGRMQGMTEPHNGLRVPRQQAQPERRENLRNGRAGAANRAQWQERRAERESDRAGRSGEFRERMQQRRTARRPQQRNDERAERAGRGRRRD